MERVALNLPDIIHHIDEAEFAELMHLWDGFQNGHDSSLIVFLDGMDECDSDASALEVMNLFNTSVLNRGQINSNRKRTDVDSIKPPIC